MATVKGDMTSTDLNKNIVVEPERNGSLTKGDALDLMVYTSAAISEVGMLKVTVKDASGAVVGAAEITRTAVDKAHGAVIHTTVSSDVDCSTMSVVVEAVDFLKITKVELVNGTLHTYRITFSRPVVGDQDESNYNGTKDGSNANNATAAANENGTILVTVPAEIENDGTIVVTATSGPVDADNVGLKQDTTKTYSTTNGWG